MIDQSTPQFDWGHITLKNLQRWLTPVTWYQILGAMGLMAGLGVAVCFTLFFRESAPFLILWILSGLVVSAVGIFVLVQETICQFYNITRDQLFCGGLYLMGLLLFIFSSMWFALNPQSHMSREVFQIAGLIALMTWALMESSEVYLAFKTICYLMAEF